MIKLINSIELTKEILDSLFLEIAKIFNFLFNKNNIENNISFKLYIDKNLDENTSKIFSIESMKIG